ncbi:MAG: hypothetical protein NTU61_03715, partial [Candidatus Altiarchaeota archaeon]|nr:hypothetical protein [Candidatus Altiarchaeota archaeon]
HTIPADPYLKNYDDAVLNDLHNLIGSRNKNGLWVVAYVNSTSSQGKFVYTPEESGIFYYIDASSGKIMRKTAHTGSNLV